MSIFYLDPENGNDGNDGLTFANRWKTLTSGATAARMAPGDTIRVMASRGPFNVGLGTWTDSGAVVALATPPFKVAENCDSGWLGVTNVTVSHVSGTVQLAIAAAFTTGKMAFKTLAASTDFSAFQQLCFLMTATTTPVTVDMHIALCSDTEGDVVVDTLPFNFGTTLAITKWRKVLIDKGSALSAGINSIAIYANVDPSTQSKTVKFNNFVACKGPDDPLCITNRSLVGKNTAAEPEWYYINELDGTNLDTSVSVTRKYRGVTETVDSWVINPTQGWDSTQYTLAEGGTDELPVLISGGWNRTDMSSQVGDTWLTGYGYLLRAYTSSANFVIVENIGVVNYYPTSTDGAMYAGHGWEVDTPGVIGCYGVLVTTSGGQGAFRFKFTCAQTWGHLYGIGKGVLIAGDLKLGRIHGVDASSAYGLEPGYFSDESSDIQFGKIDNCTWGAMYVFPANHKIRVRGMPYLGGPPGLCENNGKDVYYNATPGGELLLDNVTLTSGSTINASFYKGMGSIKQTRINGDPKLSRTDHVLSFFESQNTVVNAAGYAWKLSVSDGGAFTGYWSKARARYPLASFAVEAGKLVTVKCQVRRNSLNAECGLYFKDAELPGVAQTTVLMTAAVDTWEELTITCTPATAGVMTVYACGRSQSGTVLAYFDTVTVEQAV